MVDQNPNFINNVEAISNMIWNVQGAGNREFLRALKELVRTHRPKVLTLVETHMGGEHAARVASILGFDGHTRVDAQGFSVEFAGASHTWARGNTPHTQKSARLDRAICNGEWSLRFEHAQVKHLLAIQSDHCPLLISPNGFSPLASIKRPFRFQAAWMSHEAFKDFVDA
ncbi:Protein FixB, partial [Bienertia sinuspersici]